MKFVVIKLLRWIKSGKFLLMKFLSVVSHTTIFYECQCGSTFFHSRTLPELWQIKSEDSVTADYDVVVVVIAYHHQRHNLTSRVCDIHNKGYASKNKHRGRFTENR